MIIKKIKFYSNYEKEEIWLNEMAARGLNLISYTFCRYCFEEGTPGEYNYRLELLDESPTHNESKEYIMFMQESGIEYIDSYSRWIYFRKKATDGPFEIYSDYRSRIKHYQKITSSIGALVLLNLVFAIFNLLISTFNDFNLYVSILNWAIVIMVTPVLISYLKRMNSLKKDMALYDK